MALVAAISLGTMLTSITIGMFRWIDAPFPGFLVLENGVIASAGLTHWPAVADAEIFQYKIESYDGHTYSTSESLARYISSLARDTPVKYELTSSGSHLFRVIHTRVLTASDVAMLFGATLFSGIALIGVAIALAYMAPNDLAARGCCYALAITGIFAITAIDLYGPYKFFRVHALAECLLGAGAFHMAMTFPHRRIMAKKLGWLTLSAYAISLTIGVANQVLLFDPRGYTITHLAAIAWAGIAFIILTGYQIAAFLYPTTAITRQRVMILAIGTVASIAPAALVAVTSGLSGGEAPENFIAWTGAFFPLAVGYAVLKSDLLEIDSVIRRTVNYALVSLLVGVAYAAFFTLSNWTLETSADGAHPVWNVVFSLILAFGIMPLRNRTQDWVDRTFFRSSYDFRQTIESASESLSRMIDLDAIKHRITSIVQDALDPEQIELVILSNLSTNEPSKSSDLNNGSSPSAASEQTSIEIDLLSRDCPIATLKLGRRLSGRKYSRLDLGLLKVLANQGAIAIENALAFERLQDLNRTLEKRVEARTSELARALDDLTSTQNQLVQAERLAAVGELAAGMAHEVNNPLNFARNSLRALQPLVATLLEDHREPGLIDDHVTNAGERSSFPNPNRATNDSTDCISDDVDQLMEIIETGLDRTARLVQELRDFATPKKSEKSQVLLSTIILETLQLSGSTLKERGVSITMQVCDDEPSIVGDTNGLGQVILNVVKNAIDAIEQPPGSIEVSVKMSDDSRKLIATFTDNGVGIQPENADRLFDPFFSTKPAGRGTGLGLSLCRRIIQEHQGSIEIKSAGSRGACAIISLPIAYGSTTAAPTTSTAMHESSIAMSFDES